jgi:hypothetical protein
MTTKHTAGQLALPLGPVAPDGSGRIVVGSANHAAIEGLSHPESWPFRTAILIGPPRSGKTTLAGWFGEQAGESAQVLDDADTMDETALFHRWNAAQQSATPLLLTATAREGGWPIALADLRSRLGAALWLPIGPPDDAMLAQLIAAHAEARAMVIGDEGAAYLASRAERSHLAAESLVAAIDRISLERKAPPGPGVWREALEQLYGPGQPSLL